ncbi:MAG: trypsin-like serine protease [Thiofilum sp.]|uniref:trypsin-like serine protease n=1 Tax=Thiofilum sp. TaxID=2212733 RepID=UPI0025D65AFC|nr:trypsin-like serine protease [Thiofilum sp.]MBK8454031.1 trypsin-like peptidase domain-containing protein [Thiofilum sp.]
MEPRLVARIYADEPIGTGYPIDNGLILTAWHVVEELQAKDLQLQWFENPLSEEPCCFCEVKEILSHQKWQEYDIAVLKCEFPEKIQVLYSPTMLAYQLPSARTGWESVGFPRVEGFLKKGSTGSLNVNLEGVVVSLNLDSTTNEVSLEKEKMQDGWAGMSGAPVFSLLNKRLIGLVTVHNQWMDAQLEAVSIPWLLANDADFCSCLGFSKPSVDFSEAIKHLKNYPVMASYLLSELVTEASGYKEDSEFIIEQLTKKPISTLIQLIYKLQKNHDDNTKKVFSRLLRLLLPCIFDRSYIPFISNNKNPEAGVVVLPYATDLSAEMLMAAFDKREACFRVFSNDNKLTARAGRYRLPVAPEAGVVSTEKNIADIDLDLKNRFGKNCNLGAMHIAIDKELFKITDEPSYSEFDTEEVQLLIQSELRRRDGKAPSYYWIFIFGKNEDENQRMRQFAVELKLKYPEIVQLSLKRDVLLIKNERDLFFQLAETQEFY